MLKRNNIKGIFIIVSIAVATLFQSARIEGNDEALSVAGLSDSHIAVSMLDVSYIDSRTTAGAEFFVTPGGSPVGDGSMANSWDLQTALSQPDAVEPGDTIWLRGGTYTGSFESTLTGSASEPIIVRAYPDEHVTIDIRRDDTNYGLTIRGNWAYYWGFELTNSSAEEPGLGGFDIRGDNNKLINLIIHDVGNNMLRHSTEIYGSLLYNNGVNGSALSHHLYTQNHDSDNPVRIVNNIIFNGYAFGVHAYAQSGKLYGIHLLRNTWFNNGVAQVDDGLKDNVLVGGGDGIRNLLLEENLGWAASPTQRSVAIGRYFDDNQDVTLHNNYLVGETTLHNNWQSIMIEGNTFYQSNTSDSADEAQFPDNAYLTKRPKGLRTFLYLNEYDLDRAHLTIYNWDKLETVNVDLSAVLQVGQTYTIRNAQNYFAPPVASGTYDGQLVALPMTGLVPAQPIRGQIDPSEYTGAGFNVFVVLMTDAEHPNNGSDRHSYTIFLPLTLTAPSR